MKPLPDLDDVEAMAARGRRSALMAARGEALETLRDASVAIQSVDFGNRAELDARLTALATAVQRVMDVADIWLWK